MAQNNAFVDLNLNKQSLIGAKIYPLLTVNRTALNAGLTAADEGLIVWDVDLNQLFAWSGSDWINPVPTITGGMIFRGGIAANANAPSNPANGDVYVFTSAGTLNGTWNPSQTVAIGDQAVYDAAATVWRYIQGNAVSASTTIEGLIELATQEEVDSGSDNVRAVTAATLAGYKPNNALVARIVRRFETLVNLAANTPLAITHNLDLATQNSLSLEVWQANAKIDLAIDTTSANALTITSNVALSNVRVVCMG